MDPLKEAVLFLLAEQAAGNHGYDPARAKRAGELAKVLSEPVSEVKTTEVIPAA